MPRQLPQTKGTHSDLAIIVLLGVAMLILGPDAGAAILLVPVLLVVRAVVVVRPVRQVLGALLIIVGAIAPGDLGTLVPIIPFLGPPAGLLTILLGFILCLS